jgi:hypothetical protein
VEANLESAVLYFLNVIKPMPLVDKSKLRSSSYLKVVLTLQVQTMGMSWKREVLQIWNVSPWNVMLENQMNMLLWGIQKMMLMRVAAAK